MRILDLIKEVKFAANGNKKVSERKSSHDFRTKVPFVDRGKSVPSVSLLTCIRLHRYVLPKNGTFNVFDG